MQYWCGVCKISLSEKEADYSRKNLNGKWLCYACQKKSISPKRSIQKNASKSPTTEAKLLYDALVKRGCRAELEKWDGFKHIDIAIVEAKVNIEVDGIHHNADAKQAMSDLWRTMHSWKKGYVTLRIPNSLVRDKRTIEKTAEAIVEFLNDSISQLEEEPEKDWWDFFFS